MFTNIQHIFFDLDRTLWDFESNSRATLTEIFFHFELDKKGIRSVADFIDVYERINKQMWNQYRNGSLSKEKLRLGRHQKTLLLFGIQDEKITREISQYYIAHSPYKVGLFDDTHETLQYLGKSYSLHIITNGFEEVQHIKLKQAGLSDYFKEIITSEAAGAKKPDVKIFRYAEELSGTAAFNAVIVGDDVEADINGGLNAGWKAIHFDPLKKHQKIEGVKTINHLRELHNLF